MPTQPGATPGVFQTDLRLLDRREGKVRDVYRMPGEPRLAIIATDRLSAFDVVMPTPIPGKGVLLTEVSAFWLRFIEERGLCPTHLISTDSDEIPDAALTGTISRRADIDGRVTIGRLCRVLPVEFVVRGYLEGSGWREYRHRGSICGVRLPDGLRQCDRLPEPIFTPATKAEQGAHDENIDAEAAAGIIDPIAGAGDFEIMAGSSSRDIRLAAIIHLSAAPGKTASYADRDKLSAYYNLSQDSRFGKDDYEALLGHPVPPNTNPRKGSYTLNTPVCELTGSLAGRLFIKAVNGQVNRMIRGKEETSTAVLLRTMIREMPLRGLLMQGGALSRAGLEALLLIFNGRRLKGLAALAKLLLKKKRR